MSRADDILDNVNYYNDPRVRGAERDFDPTVYHDDGSEEKLPTRWVVCPVCEGKGTHVNPSIDAGGLTFDDDDPAFLEEYMRGTYDVTCYTCKGRTTIRDVDWEAMTEEQTAAYARQLADEEAHRRERDAERAFGC